MQSQNKRILFLADINSAHTRKWALALKERGFVMGIFSLVKPENDWFSGGNILVFNADVRKNKFLSSSLSKTEYLRYVPQVKQIIIDFKPDILHAHYATSYGLIGALTKFHPYIISAWGSDVMSFPNKSVFHKLLLKYNLNKADLILGTSEAIVSAVKSIGLSHVQKIPFGIDLNYFKSQKVKNVFSEETTVIGTVKSLEEIYGIDILLKAFKMLCDKHPEKPLKLLIVGGGSKELEYKNLANELGIASKVNFTGKIEYSDVMSYHNMIDIFVNVSRNESFGVSVLEASACEKPVIASDVGGLKEVVLNDQTGILVKVEDINGTAKAIERLLNPEIRVSMGKQGRVFVKENFDLSKNINDTIVVYDKLIKNK